MVNSRKRNYNYQQDSKIENILPMKKNTTTTPIASTNKGANFFEAKVNDPSVNFFMSRK